MNLPAPNTTDPQVIETWQDWIAYRKEIRSPLGPVAAKKQLRFLDQWGKDKFILAIETSINRNWVGLFEPQVATVARSSPIPLWQQIKNLEQEIASHPANHESLTFDPNHTPEQAGNLMEKRKLLFGLRKTN